MTRFEVMKQWSLGFACGISGTAGDGRVHCEHWDRGFEAGYSMRPEKNRMLDEYLIKTGREPQVVVKLATKES